jgi:hypothetical protein
MISASASVATPEAKRFGQLTIKGTRMDDS